MVDPAKRVTASGNPPEPGYETDSAAPAPINPATGQHKDYWVLPEEERAKGFVRPVRRSYRHVGPKGPVHPLRDLTEHEVELFGHAGYVKFEPYQENEEGKAGRFWTQEQLDKVKAGGCGSTTTMSTPIAETYAREPKSYGATFCCACSKHLPVGEDGEFVWEDGSRVGT